jgi:hypothetical protein
MHFDKILGHLASRGKVIGSVLALLLIPLLLVSTCSLIEERPTPVLSDFDTGDASRSVNEIGVGTRVTSTDRASVSDGGGIAPVGSFVGRIELFWGDSGRRRAYSGPSRVLLVGPESGRARVVQPLDGSWEGVLPDGDYRVTGVEGEGAILNYEVSGVLSSQSPVVDVTVNTPSAWVLSVVDSVSGNDLDGITLYSIVDEHREALDLYYSNRHRVPSSGVAVIREDGASPLIVDEGDSFGIFWVEVPGYVPVAFDRNSFQGHCKVELLRSRPVEIVVSPSIYDWQDPQAGHRCGDDKADVFELEVVSERTGEVYLYEELVGQLQFHVALPRAEFVATVRCSPLQGLPTEVARKPFSSDGPAPPPVILEPLSGEASAPKQSIRLVLVLPASEGPLEGFSASVLFAREIGAEKEYLFREGVAHWRPLGAPHILGRTIEVGETGIYELLIAPAGYRAKLFLSKISSDTLELLVDCSDLAAVDVHIEEPGARDGDLNVRLSYDGPDGVQRFSEKRLASSQSSCRLWCKPQSVRVQAYCKDRASPMVTASAVAGKVTDVHLSTSEGELSVLRLSAWSRGSHAFVGSDFWEDMTVQSVSRSGGVLRKLYGAYGTNVDYSAKLRAPDWSQVVFVISPPGEYRIELPSMGISRLISLSSGITSEAILIE